MTPSFPFQASCTNELESSFLPEDLLSPNWKTFIVHLGEHSTDGLSAATEASMACYEEDLW